MLKYNLRVQRCSLIKNLKFLSNTTYMVLSKIKQMYESRIEVCEEDTSTISNKRFITWDKRETFIFTDKTIILVTVAFKQTG